MTAPHTEPPPNVALVRVRMHHMDPVSVYHGRVFDLFEEARTEVFRRLGFAYRAVEEAGAAMIAIDVGARFHRPLHFDDLLAITVTVTTLTRVRLTVAYEARREGEATVTFAGHTAFAFIDVARGRAVAVPPDVVMAVRGCPGIRRDGANAPPLS